MTVRIHPPTPLFYVRVVPAGAFLSGERKRKTVTMLGKAALK